MNTQSPVPELSEFEKDALREIINLAFGEAAAGLAEVMGIYVFLNVPLIQIMSPSEISSYIEKELSLSSGLNIVEQYYIGKIRGVAFLVMSYENAEDILSILGDKDLLKLDDYAVDLLTQETLVEIGNIVIGACVSKIAEILSDSVMYLPPRYLGASYNANNLPPEFFKSNSYVVMLKTIFKFETKEINGFLFLVNSYDSLQWLRDSIDKFVANYV